jgi:hypothetical protein
VEAALSDGRYRGKLPDNRCGRNDREINALETEVNPEHFHKLAGFLTELEQVQAR